MSKKKDEINKSGYGTSSIHMTQETIQAFARTWWTMEDLSLPFRVEDKREKRVTCLLSHAVHVEMAYSLVTFGQFEHRLISKYILSN